MKLVLDKDDVGDIITQLVIHGHNCDHSEIDECCVYCRAKIIIYAWDESELELENTKNKL